MLAGLLNTANSAKGSKEDMIDANRVFIYEEVLNFL